MTITDTAIGSIPAGATIECDGTQGTTCIESLTYSLSELSEGLSPDPSADELTEQATELAAAAGWRNDFAGDFCPTCAPTAPTEDDVLGDDD